MTGRRLLKRFMAEVERAERLDREGEQALASLANVAQRLPMLLGAEDEGGSSGGGSGALGVLASSCGAREKLLRRHFAALEKSRAFLSAALRDYVELVAALPALLAEALRAQTAVLDAGEPDAMADALRRLEWMEDVARMLQRELARKRRIEAEMIVYHDAALLAAAHTQWPSRSRWSHLAVDYVRAGMESPPALPAAETSGEQASEAKSKKKKSKASKKKKKKEEEKKEKEETDKDY